MNAPNLTRATMEPQRVVEPFAQLRSVALVELLDGGTVTRGITHLRRELMWLLRELTAMTYQSIGDLFGGRDPSTVMAGVSAITERMLSSADYAAQMEQARAYILAYRPEPNPTAPDAATVLARRVMADHGANPKDAVQLAVAMVSAAAILRSPDLTDAEARLAALTIIRNGGGAAAASYPL